VPLYLLPAKRNIVIVHSKNQLNTGDSIAEIELCQIFNISTW